MSWRVVVISNRAKLDYKMDYLVVRSENDCKRIHLSEITVLLIESTAVSLTAYLLCELSKRKINIIFCDEKRLPFLSVNSLYGSHDTSLKLKTQISWSSETKKFIWAEIVRSKIIGQYSVLEKYKKDERRLLDSYRNYFKKKLFVFLNLKSFLTEEELQLLYKSIAYEGFCVLLIESCVKNHLNHETTLILDNDLCII